MRRRVTTEAALQAAISEAIRTTHSSPLPAPEDNQVTVKVAQQKPAESSPNDAATTRGLTMRRIDDLLALELPPPEPVISPVIFTDEIVQIVAFRGTGKTYLGLTMAVAVAAGVDPISGWTVPRPRPTIYVDGELPQGRLKERVKAVCTGLGIEGSIPMYTISKTDIENRGRFRSLSTPEGRGDLTECINQVSREHGVMPVLFIDSLATLLDASDENARESFAAVGEWLIELRGRGVVPIFFHHTGWNQEHGRGTSAREDIIDTSVRLRAPSDRPDADGARFDVIFDKARNFEPGQAVNFELRLEKTPAGGVVWSRAEIGERQQGDRRAAILDAVTVSPGCSVTNVCKVVLGRKQDILRDIKNMIDVGELVNEGRGQAFRLFVTGSRPTDAGTGSGTGFSTGTSSGENISGNSPEPVGNRLGTGSGTGTGSPVPTPKGGCGNHHGKPPVPADSSLDPSGSAGPPKAALAELPEHSGQWPGPIQA